jgi:HAMP domain-containing protein
MKIRTRLLLAMLPAFVGSLVLIAFLLFNPQISMAIIGISLLMIFAMASLYLIAEKISAPVQKLNNSALTIAAGEYGESIQVQGPKELKELANTLNTMSQCLLENINRLKENSLYREKMEAETECARLLQNLLLQKNIDECTSESIAVKAISFSSPSPRGLLIDFPLPDHPQIITVHMAEAKLDGFEGIYQLLTQYKLAKEHHKEKLPFPSIRLTLNQQSSTIIARSTGCATPYLWSLADGELHELKGKYPMRAGDFVFLMNRGFFAFFKSPEKVADLLTKVLKHFAQDGLETSAAMLGKEIAFATKRKDLIDDLHLLCIQILQPTH